MNILLEQALVLTVVGMGMTFVAIGLLVVGMYAMTALIKDKALIKNKADEIAAVDEIELLEAPVAQQPAFAIDPGHPQIAAAAAVAAMLAEYNGKAQAAAAAVAVAWATQSAAPSTAPSAWNVTRRGQQLAQRKYHDLRRNK